MEIFSPGFGHFSRADSNLDRSSPLEDGEISRKAFVFSPDNIISGLQVYRVVELKSVSLQGESVRSVLMYFDGVQSRLGLLAKGLNVLSLSQSLRAESSIQVFHAIRSVIQGREITFLFDLKVLLVEDEVPCFPRRKRKSESGSTKPMS